MAKGHIGLIHVSPNQSLIDEYEKDILQYLSVWEDKFWYDDFYPAWKDDRIGGARETLVARREAMKGLLQGDEFERFKQMRLKELDEQIAATESREAREKLTKEKHLLSASTDFISFGSKMGNFRDYNITADFEKYKRSLDFMTDNEDNRKQVNWTLDHLSPLVKERYALMQGLSFTSDSERPNLKPVQSKVAYFHNTIQDGLKYYKEHAEDSWYFREHGRLDHRDKISFSYIRKYAFQAKGVAQAYEDALTAIMSSPSFEEIRQYYIDKAVRENDMDAKVAWENGSQDYIINYAMNKGKVPRASTFSDLHMAADAETVSRLVIPNLQRLEKVENQYNFMVACVNEYKSACQKDPSLLNKLRGVEVHDKPVRLNLSNDRMISSLKTTMGLADLMVQRKAVSEGIYNGTKAALIVGACALTAGAAGVTLGGASTFMAGMYTSAGVKAGFAAGLVTAGADIGASSCKTVVSWEEDAKNWFDDTWVNQWFSDIKNSHVRTQIQQTVKDQIKLTDKAEQRIAKTNLTNFDMAIEYGLAHAQPPEDEVLRFVKDARGIAKLSEAEKNEYIKRVRAASVANQQALAKDSRNLSLLAEEQELANELLLIQAARTGKYFYYAKLATDVKLSVNTGETVEEHVTFYNEPEASMIAQLSKVSNTRAQAEIEAENRELLLNAWENAGRPKPNKDEQGKTDSQDTSAEMDEALLSLNFGGDSQTDKVERTNIDSQTDKVEPTNIDSQVAVYESNEMDETLQNLSFGEDTQTNEDERPDIDSQGSMYESNDMDEVLLNLSFGKDTQTDERTNSRGRTLSRHAQRYDDSNNDGKEISQERMTTQHL